MPKFQALTAAAIVAAGILMTLGGQGRDPAGSALSHLGALIGQGSSEEIPRVSGRVLLLTALVFGLLAVNSFSARLISTLSVQVKKIFSENLSLQQKNFPHQGETVPKSEMRSNVPGVGLGIRLKLSLSVNQLI